jgi:hypothetical protein
MATSVIKRDSMYIPLLVYVAHLEVCKIKENSTPLGTHFDSCKYANQCWLE